MKPTVRNVIELFNETAKRVELELKRKGFVLPVAHEDGIKFKHVLVRKYHGFYQLCNLHNPKVVYYKDIANIKIAMTMAILLGCKQPVDEQELMKLDHDYSHHYNNLRFLTSSFNKAVDNNDHVRVDILASRMDYYQEHLEDVKNSISIVLNKAEKLLFENK